MNKVDLFHFSNRIRFINKNGSLCEYNIGGKVMSNRILNFFFASFVISKLLIRWALRLSNDREPAITPPNKN